MKINSTSLLNLDHYNENIKDLLTYLKMFNKALIIMLNQFC